MEMTAQNTTDHTFQVFLRPSQTYKTGINIKDITNIKSYTEFKDNMEITGTRGHHGYHINKRTLKSMSQLSTMSSVINDITDMTVTENIPGMKLFISSPI